MPEVVVISDDLTGGSAVGAEFARHGLKVDVCADPADATAFEQTCDVLVVNTETRNASPAEAVAAMRAAASIVSRLRPSIVFKKIDSLLRGPFVEELDSLLSHMDENRCLLLAASPTVGRTTRDGLQYVEGKPLTEGLKKADPSAGERSSRIADLVGQASGRAIRELPLSHVRGPSASLRDELRRDGIFVADAETEGDLMSSVRAARGAGLRVFVGTYGLGDPLARMLTEEKGGTLIVVCGSLSAVTWRQAGELARLPGWRLVHIAACGGGDELMQAIERARQTIGKAVEAGEDIVVTTAEDPDIAGRLALDAARSGSRLDLERRVNDAMHEAIEPALADCRGIIVSGGSTARGLLRALGASGVRLDPQEVLPGMPAGRLVGGTHDGMRFLSKPGSYGAPDALVKAQEFLRPRA